MVNPSAIAGLAVVVGVNRVLAAKLRPEWGRAQLTARFVDPSAAGAAEGSY